MMQYSLVWLFLVGFFFQGNAQQSQDFKYIRVPEKFDFLKEANKYQLNALTAFLFEKQDYVVLYKLPAPQGVDPCEILQAEVENNSNLFRSKVKVVLRDCDQQVVFSSKEGTSRKKDFKASYHEALREAFESLQDVRIASLNPDESFEMQQNSSQTVGAGDKVYGSKDLKAAGKEPSSSADFSYFINGNARYELRKSDSGYLLFKEGEDQKFGTLTRSGGGQNFIYTSSNIQGNAYFNEVGDLIVEYVDANSDQLVSVRYRSLDQ